MPGFRNIVVTVILIVSFAGSFALTKLKYQYPEARRNESVIDSYFGTKVSDPYRWLESMDTKDTKAFVQAQHNLLNYHIKATAPMRRIRDFLIKLWAYPKDGLPKKRGDNYFLYKDLVVGDKWEVLKDKSIDSLYAKNPEVFLHSDELSTSVAFKEVTFSKNGAYGAYTLSKLGSDWTTIRVRNVSSSRDFPEVLDFTKFTSIAWTHDNQGFFYTRYPQVKEEDKLVTSLKHQKVYYHLVGTPQYEDPLVVEIPQQPSLSIEVELTDDGNYLLVSAYEVINEYLVFYSRISDALRHKFKEHLTLTPLFTKPAYYAFVGNDGDIFYFMTNEDAANYKTIGVDLKHPGKEYWKAIIPEHHKDVLNWVYPIANDKLVTSHMRDVKSTLELRHLRNGTLIKEFPLETGAIQNIEGKREDSKIFVKLATFTNPGVSYKLDLLKEPFELEVFKKTELAGLDTSIFETLQVFYESKDGTKIPMFITKRKGVRLTGDLPTLMYAYGGFSISTEPFFSVEFLAFVHSFNGVFAVPNIRGGGEYGTKWWNGGRLLNKHNSFDDFHAAAEYLINNNYTNPSKLTIQGRSNGGLLVATCINQRPELYGAAIIEVGVLDMLRFQKFTIGAAWCGEYGCSENKTHFHNLIKYSPLHNIRPSTTYPAVLVTTADNDDRVVPLHSYKYIAQLQHTVGRYVNQTQPLLIRVLQEAGHGNGGKTTWKRIEDIIYRFSFMQKVLGYEVVL